MSNFNVTRFVRQGDGRDFHFDTTFVQISIKNVSLNYDCSNWNVVFLPSLNVAKYIIDTTPIINDKTSNLQHNLEFKGKIVFFCQLFVLLRGEILRQSI